MNKMMRFATERFFTAIWVASVVLTLFPNTSNAARFTGSYLLQMCEKDMTGSEIVQGGHAVCQSYIAGVIDSHNMMRSFGRDFPSVEFCVPQSTTMNELHIIVLEFLRANEQHDDYIATPAVVTALYNIYPC